MRRLGHASGIVLVGIAAIVAANASAAPPKKPKGPKPPTTAPSTQPAWKVKLSEITREMIGQMVSVRATVDNVVEKPSRTKEKVYIVTLKDGEAQMELVYWEDVAKKIPDERKPRKDDRIRVTGKVSEFRTKLQITLLD